MFSLMILLVVAGAVFAAHNLHGGLDAASCHLSRVLLGCKGEELQAHVSREFS